MYDDEHKYLYTYFDIMVIAIWERKSLKITMRLESWIQQTDWSILGKERNKS